MLFVLPFLVMAIAFLSGYFSLESLQSVQVKGVINMAYINQLDKSWLSAIGFVMVLGVAYLIFFLSERFKLLGQTTTLPSLIYILLTSGIMVNVGFDYLLMAVFIVTVAVWKLQMAINDTKSNGALYDFGFLIALSVAIYPKFILLIAWAFGVLFFSGRSTLKDIVALWLGILTPVLFIAFYYFWTDRLELLPAIFTDNLMVGEHIHRLPVIDLVRLGMIVLVLIIALTNLSARYSLMIVNQRRGILSLVSMMIFLSLTFVIIPGNYYDFMYMFAVPLSFLYAQYFICCRTALFSNLVFVLLLAACFLTYLV